MGSVGSRFDSLAEAYRGQFSFNWDKTFFLLTFSCTIIGREDFEEFCIRIISSFLLFHLHIQ